MARYTSDENLGKKHGKYDMDRVGLFSEMPYMIGNKYKQPDSSEYGLFWISVIMAITFLHEFSLTRTIIFLPNYW